MTKNGHLNVIMKIEVVNLSSEVQETFCGRINTTDSSKSGLMYSAIKEGTGLNNLTSTSYEARGS